MKSFDLHADIGYDIMQKKNKGYKENILKTYHLPKFEQGEIAYICMASFFDGHEDWTDMQDMIQTRQEAAEAAQKTGVRRCLSSFASRRLFCTC